ncbi:hypothetical protein [Leifsonia sp. PS1209]|uniref:hypothetical protein n=1 Tax=Leifsonia sp. PS1209 TaxID=2724914 RepID=UPI001442B9B6|nr:hypothetical protein [Leifsonia sp. PS1209]QIZ99396.1 hypothetical protein HF024_13350 [Leifsonia sp. PS1209]
MRGTLAVFLAVAVVGFGFARAPMIVPEGSWCIPLLMDCSTPTPSPTPTPTGGSGVPGVPGIPGAPASPGTTPSPTPKPTPGTPAAPATPAPPAGPDTAAPVFTQPPAQLGSSSLSFAGLRSLSVVTIPLADGTRIPVLKLAADEITIDGFSLTVRKATGPILATTADRMRLRGNVQVYLDSVTATGKDGKSLTLGASTPPPADGLPPQLLKVTLGLVGVTADQITFTNPHQHLTE